MRSFREPSLPDSARPAFWWHRPKAAQEGCQLEPQRRCSSTGELPGIDQCAQCAEGELDITACVHMFASNCHRMTTRERDSFSWDAAVKPPAVLVQAEHSRREAWLGTPEMELHSFPHDSARCACCPSAPALQRPHVCINLHALVSLRHACKQVQGRLCC